MSNLILLSALASSLKLLNHTTPVSMSFTELSPLSGYTYCYATGINSSDHVVGYCDTGSGTTTQAFYYDGTMHALGGTGTIAYAINANDVVVGISAHSVAYWQNPSTSPSTTTLVSLTNYTLRAYGLNDSNVAAGSYYQYSPAWFANLQQTGAFTTSSYSHAKLITNYAETGIDVNNSGYIVGSYYDTTTGFNIGYLTTTGLASAGTYESTSADSVPKKMNASEDIAGYYGTDLVPDHAAVWAAASTRYDLGTLSGGAISSANGINDVDDVTGDSALTGSAFHHAFVKYDVVLGSTSMVDVNSYYSGDHAVTIFEKGTGINSDGSICGNLEHGTYDSRIDDYSYKTHAFIGVASY